MEERMPTIFRESSKTRMPILEKADRVTSGIKSTDGSPNDLGRLFAVQHGWKKGSAGMLRSIGPYGITAIDIGNAARIQEASNYDGTMAPIPSAKESPHVGHFTRTLYLHANIGNLGLPIQWMFLNSLSAMKVDQIVEDMVGCADKTVRQDAVSYSSYRATGASTYQHTVLGRIASFQGSAAGTSGLGKHTDDIQARTTNAHFVKFAIDEAYGTINNFMEGDEVDLVANSGGSATAAGTLQDGVATDASDVRNYTSGAVYIQCVITNVDRIAKTITLIGVSRQTSSAAQDAIVSYSDSTGWQGTTGPAQYDWICPRGGSTYIAATRPWLTNGVEDWMKGSGQIMGGAAGSEGLDLDSSPGSMFKSIVRSNLASRLTPEFMNQALAQFAVAFPEIKLNACVTTMGVLLGFQDEIKQTGQGQFEVNQKIDVSGGWSFSKWVTPTGSVDFWTSPYCLAGRAYIQQIDPSNLKLYGLPVIGETKSDFAPGIQFLGKILGWPSIRVPETAANGTASMIVGAPFIRFALLCPIRPNGIKIGGITEADITIGD
jgi:hypothetical protein